MEKFKVNESVVFKHDDGTSSGKVVKPLENNTYLVNYIGNGGWCSGLFHSSQLTSLGTALFLIIASYEAELAELEGVEEW